MTIRVEGEGRAVEVFGECDLGQAIVVVVEAEIGFAVEVQWRTVGLQGELRAGGWVDRGGGIGCCGCGAGRDLCEDERLTLLRCAEVESGTAGLLEVCCIGGALD